MMQDALPDNIHVGMGGRKSTNIAHFYVGDEDFKKGVCLCGRTVKPILEFEHWNLDEALIQECTCPDCMKRIKLYRYFKNKRI